MSEKRIVELETKQAYQEDLIQDLNKIIFEQQKRLEKLEEACKYLLEQTKELAEITSSDGSATVDEKPPHY